MPLAQLQRALAHLYTDQTTRDLFGSDPAAFATAFGLDPVELAQVASMGGASLRAYTDSLDRKRANACAGLLPLSARGIGPRFRAEFVRFARGAPLGDGPHRYRDDASAFAAHIRRSRDSSGIGAAQRALLAYESRRSAGIAFYRYFVPDLARSVLRGDAIAAAPPRWTVVLRFGKRREMALGMPPRQS